MVQAPDLAAARERYVRSVQRTLVWPAADSAPAGPAERGFAAALRQCVAPVRDQLAALAGDATISDCYPVLVFGIRLAIDGACQAQPQSFRAAQLPLLATGSIIDRRDLLGAMAVYEACAQKLSLDFQAELEALAEQSGQPLSGTLAVYFKRDAAMRTVEVMGLRECRSGSSFTFRTKC